MIRRTVLVTLVSAVAATGLASVLTAPPADAASSTTVRVRTLPGIVGTGGTQATKDASANDLVVAWTSPQVAGRSITFYTRNFFGGWTQQKVVKTNAAGEASFSGQDLAGQQWKVTAAKTSRTSAATYEMPQAPTWTQTFTDDFNGTKLSAQWRQRYPDQWLPGRACSYSSPSRVSVGGGAVYLTTKRYSTSRPSSVRGKKASAATFKKKCKDASGRAYVYQSSGIDTATHDANTFSLSTGVVAARAKFSTLPGQHASVWLPAPRAKGTEIDIIESNGAYRTGKKSFRSLVAGVYYGSNGKVQQTVSQSASTWAKSYHVYSVEWTRTQYVFRIDGRVVVRTSKGATTAPHHIALTNFVADWEIRQNNGKPATATFDWVKAWQ